MDRLSQKEAEARRQLYAFNMKIARRRYRQERKARITSKSFRKWAASTYAEFASAGKLQSLIRRTIHGR